MVGLDLGWRAGATFQLVAQPAPSSAEAGAPQDDHPVDPKVGAGTTMPVHLPAERLVSSDVRLSA